MRSEQHSARPGMTIETRVVLTREECREECALKTRMLNASPTAAFAQRRRSYHVFDMVHQILLQAIGHGTPQFFLVYRVK